VSDLTTSFKNCGYSCPASYNPADFVMSLSQTESIEKLKASGIMDISSGYSGLGFESAALSNSSKSAITTSASSTHLDTELTEVVLEVQASFCTQLYALIDREIKNVFRNKGALIGRFGITIFLNTIFGLIFLNAGGKNDAISDNFNAHFGAVTMVTISGMFGAAQPMLLMFPFERPLFMREFSTGTCK
jgi:hypothetical protein